MDLKVLILEDDELSIKHIQSLLNQLGVHDVKACGVHDFEFVTSIEHFHIIILDGFLEGGVSGLDMISKVDLTDKNTFIWFISGVVRKEHIPRKILPSIHSFFKKPIREEEFQQSLQKVKKEISKNVVIEGISDSFFNSYYSKDGLEAFVKNSPTVQGHELATLLYLCSESQWTGKVRLRSSIKQYDTNLMFLNGNLVSIQTADQKSFFGVLAKAYGFVTEKITKDLIAKGEKDKPIGYKLVHSGHISPHSVYFILEEQFKIRLSRLMGSQQNYKIQLIPQEVQKPEDGVVISFQQKPEFLLEILWGKIDLSWLENFFFDKNHYTLNLNHRKGVEVDGRWKDRFNQIIKIVDSKKTFSEIEKDLCLDSHEFLFSMYYLLVSKCLTYKTNQTSDKFKLDLEMRIKKIKSQMENGNYFDFLVLQKTASEDEIKYRIKQVIKNFHPDRYTEPAIKKLCNEVLFYFNEMKDTLLDKEKRQNYIQKIDRKDRDGFVLLFSKYKEGKEAMEGTSKNYARAFEIFESIQGEKSLPEDANLYYVWAFLKTHSLQPASLKSISKILEKVSVEMKYTALYFYVKALYYIDQDEKNLAKTYLEKSLDVDENFFPARMEWAQFKQNNKSILKKLFFKAS